MKQPDQMNNKITLATMSAMLGERTGRQRKECEELLRSFFQTIGTALCEGESVKVKGFGTFKISKVDSRMSVDVTNGRDYEIPAHNRVVFLPAKELAGAVNAPFEMFDTIELDDALTEQELLDAETTTGLGTPLADALDPRADQFADEAEEAQPSEMTAAAAPAPHDATAEALLPPEAEGAISEDAPQVPDESLSEPEADVEPTVESKGAATLPLQPEETPEEDASTSGTDIEAEHKRRFSRGFIWGAVATVAVLAAGFMALYWLNSDFRGRVDSARNFGVEPTMADSQAKVEAPDTASTSPASKRILPDGTLAEIADMGEIESGMADMVEDVAVPGDRAIGDGVVPTGASDNPVYDTITPHTGLGTIARKHYGNYHFWPYIYKENASILGHPDRIRPGTRVVVPPLAKYGVDPRNPKDVAKAKRLDAEIYSRFRKSGKQ